MGGWGWVGGLLGRVIIKLTQCNCYCNCLLELSLAKFEAIGVTVKVMNTKSTAFGKFSGSVVEISPVNLNTIWGRRLGLENCSIIAFDE